MSTSKHYLFSGMKYRPSDVIAARDEQSAANKIARGLHLLIRETGPHSYILCELIDGADIPGTEFTMTDECPNCNGHKRTWFDGGIVRMMIDCETCNGKGYK